MKAETEIEIVPVGAAAERLHRSELTLRNAEWRKRVNLPAIRANGRLIGFAASDIEDLLRRGRERFDEP